MKPGMTAAKDTIDRLLQKTEDPGMAAVYGYLWDFTTDRDIEMAELVKECENLIAQTENFRRYLTGVVSEEALLK